TKVWERTMLVNTPNLEAYIISPLKTNRIEWIDTIKGICIILVIIYHTCGLPIIGQFLFGGFMGTFFILSGYTTKKDIISSGIKKKDTVQNFV
ncbi:acyltransferase family protein, partial [Phocaeicola coprocola]|uniref:acyltransferase family protein n=2 Tax=Phocaeicola coprocola TaxID=310298 RepID=UPI001C393DFD